MPLDQLISHLTQHARTSGIAPLTFCPSDHFHWHHPSRTVYYDPHDTQASAYLLHEYGHALLGHRGYAHDVQLVAMERAAWSTGCRVGAGWQLTVDDDFIESALDTYRDWLHARSQCPHCNATGLQRSDGTYTCLACFTHWRANNATTCQLRRYVVKSTII
jgi:hypothetical protein cdiviTM7_01560